MSQRQENFQELAPSGIEELERETHEALTPWILDHAQQSNGSVSDIGYDRVRYPFQRLDTPYMPPRESIYRIHIKIIPTRLIMGGIKASLAKNLGSMQKANDMIEIFRETPAIEGGDKSISQEFEERLGQEQALAVITDHLKKGDLRDIALIMGALIFSIGTKRAREQTSIMMGLNTSRQSYGPKRKPMAEQVSQGMGIIWVMQNTGNRKKLAVPDKAVKIVNDGAKSTIEHLRQKGAAVGVVPAGTTNELVEIDGQDVYRRPPTRAAVSTLMAFDGILPVAMYEGSILPGSMHFPQPVDALNGRELYLEKITMVNNAMAELAINGAKLTGKPMIFEDAMRNWMRAEPSGEIKIS